MNMKFAQERTMRNFIPKLLILAVVVAMLGFACGGDDVTSSAPALAEPTAASPGATAAPTSPEPASLEVRVTDAPPGGVTKILLTVENIEVNAAGGAEEPGWKMVVEGPLSFDLVAVTGIEEILGSAELPPGQYGQVRLKVTEVLITINGEVQPATVPSDVLRVVGGFDLIAGATTVLTLDFDAAKSVVLRGNQPPILKPVVKLLVRRSGQPMSAAETVSEPAGDILVTPAATATLPSGDAPVPAATATPAPAAANGDGVGVQDSVEVVREISVVLTEFAITPSVLEIQAGQKVRFMVTNAGMFFHTFTFDLGDQRVSVDLLAGETGTTEILTFTTPAANPFWCAPHEFVPMTGVINVI
jgi:plastocyanin